MASKERNDYSINIINLQHQFNPYFGPTIPPTIAYQIYIVQ